MKGACGQQSINGRDSHSSILPDRPGFMASATSVQLSPDPTTEEQSTFQTAGTAGLTSLRTEIRDNRRNVIRNPIAG